MAQNIAVWKNISYYHRKITGDGGFKKAFVFKWNKILFPAGLPKVILSSTCDSPQHYRRGVISRKDETTNSLRYFHSPPLSSMVLLPPEVDSTPILPFYKKWNWNRPSGHSWFCFFNWVLKWSFHGVRSYLEKGNWSPFSSQKYFLHS